MAELPEKLLVNIEVTQRRVEKQLAKIAKQAGASAGGIEKRFNAANKNVAKSFDTSSFAAGNLAAQLNDIGVSLASGQSPFTVMIQQGSQVSQVIHQAGGSVRSLGGLLVGAFSQILNPVSLATFAIIGLGGAALNYFSGVEGGTKTADEALKAHAAIISTVKDAYSGLLDGLETYSQESITVVRELVRGNVANLEETLKQQISGIDLGDAINVGLFGGAGAFRQSPVFERLKQDIVEFTDAARAGTPDILDFRRKIAELRDIDPSNQAIQDLIDSLLDTTSEAGKTGTALESAKDAMRAIGDIAAGQVQGVKDLASALNALAGIAVPALSQADAIKANVAKGLRAIGDATTPAGAEARRRVLIAGELARQRLDATQLPGGGEIPTPTEKPSLLDYDPDKTKKTGGSRRKTNAYQSGVQSIEDRTAALQAQNAALAQINPLENDYDAAVTKARVTQQLLNDAQKAGLAITPQLKATIDAVAQGYTNASVEAQKLAESQREMQRAAAEFEALGKDVMGGFINDLIAGRSASDALANALGKVADKLIDISLNSLFDGGGGGGFNILSLLGMGGGGGGSQLAIASSGGIGLYAKGGIATKPSIFGESGAEAAVPLPDGRHIPVMLKGGRADGNGQQRMGLDILIGVDKNGNLKAFVDQRAGQAADIRVRQLDKALPDRVKQINDDPRAR